jgi:glycosyltransferase involved in cell wall biosynthesis
VLRQTFTDLELIVVDDASDLDTARQLVAEIAVADPRISYIRRDKRGGAAATRNTGIWAARGEFIAFQDDDDEWLLNKLAQQLALFERLGPQCLLVGGGLLRYIPTANSKVYKWPVVDGEAWVDPSRYIEGHTAFIQTVLVRRSAVQAVGGFNPEVPISEDYEFGLRVIEHGRMATVPEFVTVSYEQPASLSNQRPLRVISNLKILGLHWQTLRQYPKAAGVLYYEVAVNNAVLGQRADAFRYWWKAFRFDPFPFRIWLLLPMLFLGATATLRGIKISQGIKKRLGH